MESKGKKRYDKFPLLLGIVAVILGGTSLNLLNWQHKQIDILENRVHDYHVVLVHLQAKINLLEERVGNGLIGDKPTDVTMKVIDKVPSD